MKKVYDVYRVIFLFFKRKVMGFGLMKNKLFRIVLGILILAFIGGICSGNRRTVRFRRRQSFWMFMR